MSSSTSSEGEHVFTVGGTEFQAGPGDLVFGPRGVPHAHRRVVPLAGRILEMFSPAGSEDFFTDAQMARIFVKEYCLVSAASSTGAGNGWVLVMSSALRGRRVVHIGHRSQHRRVQYSARMTHVSSWIMSLQNRSDLPEPEPN